MTLDDFSWRLSHDESVAEDAAESSSKRLRYVGGVDLSFVKEESSIACGALVVMDLDSMQVVYEDFDVVQLTMPYVAGFLAFREVLNLTNSELNCILLRLNKLQIELWSFTLG